MSDDNPTAEEETSRRTVLRSVGAMGTGFAMSPLNGPKETVGSQVNPYGDVELNQQLGDVDVMSRAFSDHGGAVLTELEKRGLTQHADASALRFEKVISPEEFSNTGGQVATLAPVHVDDETYTAAHTRISTTEGAVDLWVTPELERVTAMIESNADEKEVLVGTSGEIETITTTSDCTYECTVDVCDSGCCCWERYTQRSECCYDDGTCHGSLNCNENACKESVSCW